MDVTHEHTPTSDITLHVKSFKDGIIPITAYICVLDYGRWMPLYWGSVKNNLVVFKNMGHNVIYRIATFNNELNFSGEVFLLDSTGKIKYLYPNWQRKQTMKLQKINSGSEAWVTKNTSYTLYLLEKGCKWLRIAQKICTKNSIIKFRDVPSGGLYRLVKSNGSEQLERAFTYKDNKQIWY